MESAFSSSLPPLRVCESQCSLRGTDPTEMPVETPATIKDLVDSPVPRVKAIPKKGRRKYVSEEFQA